MIAGSEFVKKVDEVAEAILDEWVRDKAAPYIDSRWMKHLARRAAHAAILSLEPVTQPAYPG